MYALVDKARSFSAINQQSLNENENDNNDDMIISTSRKRKATTIHDESEGERGGGKGNSSSSSNNGGRGKKWNDNNDEDTPPIRILSRKYLLTKTGYKFIDIGITPTLPSRVNIVVGDNYGKEIPLTPSVWKGLVEQKPQVMTHLRRGNVAAAAGADATDIHIENLTLRFGKINNMPIMTLETPTARMVLSQATVNNMYQLELCINRIVNSLCSIIDRVDAKLQRFLDIARNVPDPANIAKTIRDSDYFDRNDIIDCEILALTFNNKYQ